jgi:hypothetical protein
MTMRASFTASHEYLAGVRDEATDQAAASAD